MAEEQTVKRRGIGLFTHPNVLDIPPGGLLEAINCVIDREYVISKRRGFKRFGNQLDAPALGLIEYRKRLVVLDGDKLKYDSTGAGVWLPWTGTFQTAILGIRLRALETAGNVYVPTLKGIWKNDALNGIPVPAGMPEGLDLSLVFTGNGVVSWMDPDTAVGYRVIWGREDLNNNTIVGAPSWRETIVNPAARVASVSKAGSTTVTATLAAHGFTTGDQVQISGASNVEFGPTGTIPAPVTVTVIDASHFTYTFAGTGTLSGTVNVGKFQNVQLQFTVPRDIRVGDFFEVYRTDMTVGAGTPVGERFRRVAHVPYTAGTVITFTDNVDQEDLDLPLYTNDNEEGPTQENSRPPHARFIALYKTHVFYAFCSREQFVDLHFTSLTGVTNGDTITISAGIPLTYTFAAAENIGLREFKLFTTADPETPTEGAVREKTMKSFCRVVNRDATSLVDVFYTSGEDESSGKISIRHRHLDAIPFTVVSTEGDNFVPDITVPFLSDNDQQANVVCRSKSSQPEHVPRLNEMIIGKKNKAILGLSVNRDALFVYKEDGVFVISGETDGGGGFGFAITEYDPTAILASPNAVVTLDNASYAMTTQGGMRITQSVSGIFSRQVENEILRQVNDATFVTDSFAVSYESQRKYLLFFEQRIHCYNYLTNAWSIWLIDSPFGHVLAPETIDRLYLAHGSEPFVLEERKSGSFSNEDYQDEEYADIVTAVSTTIFQGRTVSLITVTHTYYQPITAGWSFTQGIYQANVEIVEVLSPTSYRLTLSKLLTGVTT